MRIRLVRYILVRYMLMWMVAGWFSFAVHGQGRALYVEPFEGGANVGALHDSVVRYLSKSHGFRVVDSAAAADAIVKGKGQLWVRGYISTNTRTPASNRHAVYGGYLSLQLMGKDGQPLWSWLATPGRLAWKNVVDDLADQTVKKLVAAEAAGATAATGPATVSSLAQTTLHGGGATFPAPLYQKWFEDFEALHPGVHVPYAPVGSQNGVDTLLAGKLDFAGSDIAPEAISANPAAGQLRRVASVLGAVVVIYNLNGGPVEDIHFTPEALADIYMGRVRRWNDAEIRRSNPGVDLPDAEIVVIHRSDGSGTTWAWSHYLAKVSAAWSSAMGSGAVLRWPVGTGVEGSEGVADAVQKTPNSIGYVELAYAIQHQLSFAGIRNRAGEYVHADLDSLTEAATSAGAAGGVAEDISDSPGKNAYPIAAYTWLVLPTETAEAARKAALIELLRWVLGNGQKECSSLGYAPLPRSVVDLQLQKLDALR